MPVHPSQTLSVDIQCTYEKAYAFLVQPLNFPKWASGLAESLTQEEDRWIAQTPQGPVEVRFSPANDFGVLDHFVVLNPHFELHVPMRLLRNGEGCTILLTLFHLPSMTDEHFARDLQWVRRDLDSLNKLLETAA